MNPDLPQNEREKLEFKLTALLLGELPPHEEAALFEAMNEDAELAALYERLKLTVDLVRESSSTQQRKVEGPAVKAPELKLSPERREKLLAHFKTVTPKEFVQPPRKKRIRMLEIAAAVAAVAILAALLIPALASRKSAFKGDSTLSMDRSKGVVWSTHYINGAEQKGGAPQGQAAAPAPANQTKTFGLQPTPPPAATPPPARTTIVLPASNDSAGNQQLAMNNAEQRTPGQYQIDGHTITVMGGSQPLDSLGFTNNQGVGSAGVVTAGVTVTNDFTFSDSYMLNGNNRTSSQLNSQTDGEQAKKNTPLLGDVPVTGSLFSGTQTNVARSSGEFYTGLSRPDANGLGGAAAMSAIVDATNVLILADKDTHNLVIVSDEDTTKQLDEQIRKLDRTNGKPAEEPQMVLAGNMNTQNSPLMQREMANAPAATAPVNIDTLSGYHAAEKPKAPPAAQAPAQVAIALPPVQDPTTGLPIVSASEGPAPVATTTAPTRNDQLVTAGLRTRGPGGGGGFGGFGGAGGLGSTTQSARLPRSGKQVEVAAAAKSEATKRSPSAPETASEATRERALGFDWYLGNRLMSNESVVASGGTTPSQDAAITALSQSASSQSASSQASANPQGAFDPTTGQPISSTTPAAATRSAPGSATSSSNVSNAQAAGYVNATSLSFATPPSSNVYSAQVVGYIDSSGFTNYELLNSGLLQSAVTSESNAKSVPAKQAELAAINYAYIEAEKKLQEEKHWSEMLKMKTGEEAVEKILPKAEMVTIVEPASAATTEKLTFWEKFRRAFSGNSERSAHVAIDQERTDVASANVNVPVSYDPYFIQTEFKVIQSETVLKKAAENLKLDKNGEVTKDTIARLRGQLDLGLDKNNNQIKIGATSENAEDAARIANAVAQAYRDYRVQHYAELKQQGIQSLQQQLADQNKKVELAQAKVDQLQKELNIPGAATLSQEADTALPKPTVPPPTPQPEMLTHENAVSTFSLNVSDVSFKLAAATLEKGQMPDPASIRSEEFINAFNYRDPEAPAGVAIAFNSERAAYPFAHNRELLRFSLKTAAAGRQAGRPLNIVLLLDNSGSMERADRVNIIREALRVLTAQLQPQDTFSIVTFARTARLRVDGVHGDQAAAAAEEIAKLTPEGGTNLGDALDAAYETALHHYIPSGDNRVVMLTDGAANLGDVDANSLKQKVEAHRKQGIALDCFGIGWEGYNDDLLEVLTRNGDGRYGFINTPEEATTEFATQIAGALHVAASDVKVQVEFNPNRVTSYRQIGYAKHQLTTEQFRDNTVNAAPMAAQEAGNALYTIEINPQGEGSIGTVHVRYRIPGTGDYREQAWDVPYTGSASSMDQASPAMRLAATASAFSEWLATSPFADEVSTDQLLHYLNGVPQVYGADTRPQKLEWMIRRAKSISGK